MLINMSVSSYPHMVKNDRERLHRSTHNAAYPEIYEQERVELTPESLSAALGG